MRQDHNFMLFGAVKLSTTHEEICPGSTCKSQWQAPNFTLRVLPNITQHPIFFKPLYIDKQLHALPKKKKKGFNIHTPLLKQIIFF